MLVIDVIGQAYSRRGLGARHGRSQHTQVACAPDGDVARILPRITTARGVRTMSRRSTLLAGLGGLAMTLLLLVPARAQISDYSPELTVEGLVSAPRTYTVDALRRLPATDVAIQGVDDV